MFAPILSDILNTVRSLVQDLELPGLATANVIVQKVAGDRPQDLPAVKYPCLLIAPHGAESADPQSGTNLRDDVVYPIRVTILAEDAGDQQFGLTQYLGWRERLRRRFHNQRLSPDLCFTVQVQPLTIVDPAAWHQRGLFVSSLVLHCFSRESRGPG